MGTCCDICHKKIFNCDCTSTEKDQHQTIEEMEDQITSLKQQLVLAKDRLADAVNCIAVQEQQLLTAKEEGARNMLNFLYKAGEIVAIRDVNELLDLWREQNGN